MPGPLSHIRVLDLSRVLAGPWCTQILADLGAEVIKVERPGRGDDTRAWGPPFVKRASGEETSDAAYFMSANRGKKSIAVDITSAEGQDIIRKLAERADIVLENYKVGGLAKYGLDYASLSRDHPKLIYCSITGFGQTGPYKDRAGYDFITQGMSGMMSITGVPDGMPGAGPQKAGVAISDLTTGLYAAIAILSALAARERTGRGDYIDMSLLDCSVAVLSYQAMNYLMSGKAPTRMGNAHPNLTPYEVFATSDGHIIIAVGNDQQFQRLCRILGLDEMAEDPRFATNRARLASRAEMLGALTARLAARTSAEWIAALEKAGVPCGPINTIDQVFSDPQVQYRGLRVDLPHAEAERVPAVRSPFVFQHQDLALTAAAPTLGQHTRTILTDIGYSNEAIEDLFKQSVVG